MVGPYIMLSFAGLLAAITTAYWLPRSMGFCDVDIYVIGLGTTILGSALWWFLRTRSQSRKRQPPGPTGIPFLGSFEVTKRDFYYNKAMKWMKLYGPVFRFRTVAVNTVIVNDYDLMKEAFSKPELLQRPSPWLLNDAAQGLSVLAGQVWKANRRFLAEAFTELGYGKQVMWHQVQEEAQHLVDMFSKSRGAPILPRPYLVRSACNNVAFFLFGRRYDLDDPRRKDMDEHLEVFILDRAASSIDYWPAVLKALARRLFPRSLSVVAETVVKNFEAMSKRQVNLALQTDKLQRNRSIVDMYNEKVQEHGDPTHPVFTEARMVGNVGDFLLGATAVMTLFLHSHVLNFAARADSLQAAVQREIDSVVGRDRLPNWHDHVRMPLTMATIWEMYRWKACTPFGLPREAAEDTTIGGYHVPKGSVVLPNFWAVHMSPKLWKDPEIFDPSRFLRPDGSAISTRPEHIIPFSIGKRMCPGESLSTAEIFLDLTMLLQKFRILPEEGATLHIESNQPLSQFATTRLRFLPRND